MPGHDGPGNETPLSTKLAVAMIRGRIRREGKKMAKLNVGDKAMGASSSVWGTLLIAVGTLIVAVGHVLAGDSNWGHVAQVAQSVDIVGVILGVIGIIMQGVGQRKAIGRGIVGTK